MLYVFLMAILILSIEFYYSILDKAVKMKIASDNRRFTAQN